MVTMVMMYRTARKIIMKTIYILVKVYIEKMFFIFFLFIAITYICIKKKIKKFCLYYKRILFKKYFKILITRLFKVDWEKKIILSGWNHWKHLVSPCNIYRVICVTYQRWNTRIDKNRRHLLSPRQLQHRATKPVTSKPNSVM